mmetsp:Transcript_1655/g.6613  ORF Transcript_1655/g.6613 Transcript_1655/m.6613 type:complete len:305 (+) Transcript_1655:2387-3301(+)
MVNTSLTAGASGSSPPLPPGPGCVDVETRGACAGCVPRREAAPDTTAVAGSEEGPCDASWSLEDLVRRAKESCTGSPLRVVPGVVPVRLRGGSSVTPVPRPMPPLGGSFTPLPPAAGASPACWDGLAAASSPGVVPLPSSPPMPPAGAASPSSSVDGASASSVWSTSLRGIAAPYDAGRLVASPGRPLVAAPPAGPAASSASSTASRLACHAASASLIAACTPSQRRSSAKMVTLVEMPILEMGYASPTSSNARGSLPMPASQRSSRSDAGGIPVISDTRPRRLPRLLLRDMRRVQAGRQAPLS